jgi:hypothetical protein
MFKVKEIHIGIRFVILLALYSCLIPAAVRIRINNLSLLHQGLFDYHGAESSA